MNILETHNLIKHYASRRVLDNVSLSMQEGSIYGLLGPNGAGKTTFLRVINNIIVRDAGEVLFKGQSMHRALGRYLGYMPEERGLYAKMQVEEQILYFGLLKGGDRKRLTEVMHDYMDIFSIAKADGKRKVQELSKGNQQKVQIIATLVHEPELVMLDEPFSGFDPINGALLSALIEKLKNKGTTIVLSSHNMAAVEEMCTHIALINSGKLLVDGKISDIKKANRENAIIVQTSTPVDFSPLLAKNLLKSVQPISKAGNETPTYLIHTLSTASNNLVAQHVCASSQLISFQEKLPSLNELFIKFTEHPESAQKSLIPEFEKIS